MKETFVYFMFVLMKNTHRRPQPADQRRQVHPRRR